MPFFERYAEKQFDAEAKELPACFPDPQAYSLQLIMLPMKVAMRICPSSGIILPENVVATEWTDLYRTLKAAAMKSGRKGLGEEFVGATIALGAGTTAALEATPPPTASSKDSPPITRFCRGEPLRSRRSGRSRPR